MVRKGSSADTRRKRTKKRKSDPFAFKMPNFKLKY